MSDELMQRRELLRRAAWMLGGAVSAPAALAILQGCSAKEAAVSAEAKGVLLSKERALRTVERQLGDARLALMRKRDEVEQKLADDLSGSRGGDE